MAKPNAAVLPSIDSEGGPIVVVPTGVVREWRGTLAPKGARVPKGWEWARWLR